MRKWESSAAWLYYSLGVLYYVYHWVILLSLGSIALSLVPHTPRLLSVIAFPLGIVLFVGGVYAWLGRMKKRHEVLNPLLDIIASRDTYVVHDGGQYEFTIEIRVRARQSGIDGYKSKFRWTGRGQFNIEAQPSSVIPMADYRHQGGDVWELARLQFPRPLRRGEEFSFTLKLTFSDENGSSLPYLQKFVDDIYSELTMRVVLPSKPGVVVREIFLAPRSDISIFRETYRQDSNEVSWAIKRPRVGRRYKISWELDSKQAHSVGIGK